MKNLLITVLNRIKSYLEIDGELSSYIEMIFSKNARKLFSK